MGGNTTLILALTAAAAVTAGLFIRFRTTAADRLAALIGALAVALGLLMAIPGALHTMAVISGALKRNRPYDVRFAWLITTGALLIYAGVSAIWLATAMKRGVRSAMTASAAATFALVLFLGSLQPATSDFSALLIVDAAYVMLILFWLRRTREGSV